MEDIAAPPRSTSRAIAAASDCESARGRDCERAEKSPRYAAASSRSGEPRQERSVGGVASFRSVRPAPGSARAWRAAPRPASSRRFDIHCDHGESLVSLSIATLPAIPSATSGAMDILLKRRRAQRGNARATLHAARLSPQPARGRSGSENRARFTSSNYHARALSGRARAMEGACLGARRSRAHTALRQRSSGVGDAAPLYRCRSLTCARSIRGAAAGCSGCAPGWPGTPSGC